MNCINPKCNKELRIMGALPDPNYPFTTDNLFVYMCINDDCERLGLLTPMAKEKHN